MTTQGQRERPVRWGLLAASGIAAEFAAAAHATPAAELAAVASRDPARAEAFARAHGVARAVGSYQELLADPGVDAVYVSTPHPQHEKWAVRAAQAGKHVLCEKPLTMDGAAAQRVVAAAREHDVFLMEAFMVRCHPLTLRLRDLVREGAVGQVRSVDVAFSFDAGPTPPARLVDPALGGGGILDVGCYGVTTAQLVATAAAGELVEPAEVAGLARLDPTTGVDLYAAALLRYPGDLLARLTCGVRQAERPRLRVLGTDGELELPVPPWLQRGPGPATIALHRPGAVRDTWTTTEETVTAELPLFAYQLEVVARHLADRQAPECTWADSLAQARTLDRWRAAAGVRYPTDPADLLAR